MWVSPPCGGRCRSETGAAARAPMGPSIQSRDAYRPQLRHGRKLRQLRTRVRRRDPRSRHFGERRLRFPRRRSGHHGPHRGARDGTRGRDRGPPRPPRPPGLRPAPDPGPGGRSRGRRSLPGGRPRRLRAFAERDDGPREAARSPLQPGGGRPEAFRRARPGGGAGRQGPRLRGARHLERDARGRRGRGPSLRGRGVRRPGLQPGRDAPVAPDPGFRHPRSRKGRGAGGRDRPRVGDRP